MSKEMEKLAQEMRDQHRRMFQRGEELADFRPTVSFRIPATGLYTWKYLCMIRDLLVEFVRQANPDNTREAKIMEYRGIGQPNEEGGIGMCTIDGIFIDHCKLYVCDGTRNSRHMNPDNKWKPWRGIVFRDHADSNTNTAKVFIIADAFEKLLVSRGMRFRRINITKERSK
jgi:hypothetical protein